MAKKYADNLTGAKYVGLLQADFSGLKEMQSIIDKTLYGLMVRDYEKSTAKKYGVSFENYKWEYLQETGGAAQIIRNRVGRALAVVAAKAKHKVPKNKSGLEEGVTYDTFKKRLGGMVRITNSKRRKEPRKRVYVPGHQRSVKPRTRQIQEYYGRDRAFILRILNSGVDVDRVATADVHGRGSRATWGARGNIEPKWDFSSVHSDMQRAVDELGIDIKNICQHIVETAYADINK